MTLTFAGELTKMIDAGLGRESAAPDTGVAVGRYSEYIDVSDAALATFDTNAALPLRALSVNIEPIQEGTGDPSPENVRPITGRSEVKVWREATYDTSADPALTMQLGQTVYGGVLDAVNGTLMVTHKILTLDATNWSWSTGTWASGYRYFTSEQVTDAANDQSCLSSIFPVNENKVGISIDNAANSKQVDARIPNSMTAFDTRQKWLDYLSANPVTVYYALETPLTIQLTPQQIETLIGTNNVWSDGGNVSLTYTKYNYTEGY